VVQPLLIDKGAINCGWNESKPATHQLHEEVGVAKAPLEFIVKVLLVKDLMNNAPSWFVGQEFCVEDAAACQFEVNEKVYYLYLGRGQDKPALGQKLNIRVALSGNNWG